jgi:hypothetical protein
LAISFQRLNQSIGFQKEGFANQKADMAYDKALDYSNFALQTSRQRRGQGYAEADFAGAARNQDPLGAAGLGSRDAAFANALARNAQQSGRGDLFKGINSAVNASNSSFGAGVGDIAHSAIQSLFEELTKQLINFHPFGIDLFGSPGKQGGSSSQGQGQPPPISINLGNRTISLASGFDPNFQSKIEAIIAKGDQDVVDKIAALIKQVYNG